MRSTSSGWERKQTPARSPLGGRVMKLALAQSFIETWPNRRSSGHSRHSQLPDETSGQRSTTRNPDSPPVQDNGHRRPPLVGGGLPTQAPGGEGPVHDGRLCRKTSSPWRRWCRPGPGAGNGYGLPTCWWATATGPTWPRSADWNASSVPRPKPDPNWPTP